MIWMKYFCQSIKLKSMKSKPVMSYKTVSCWQFPSRRIKIRMHQSGSPSFKTAVFPQFDILFQNKVISMIAFSICSWLPLINFLFKPPAFDIRLHICQKKKVYNYLCKVRNLFSISPMFSPWDEFDTASWNTLTIIWIEQSFLRCFGNEMKLIKVPAMLWQCKAVSLSLSWSCGKQMVKVLSFL